MAKPLFDSHEQFEERARAAGLDATNCAYIAANTVVDPIGNGIDLTSRAAVFRDFRTVNYVPTSVEVDCDGRIEDWSARIGCRVCKMTVAITGGYTDFQHVKLPKDSRKQCPIFNEENPGLSDDEVFAEDFIRTGERLGYYAECFSMDDLDSKRTYYALVMPKDQYDALLEEVNERRRENSDSIDGFVPTDVLPWEVQVGLPTFRSGHANRREALLASLQAMRNLKKK